ncbi:uncharacterized protein LOC121873259 isoform X1 [Homarus americanus]|uniref:uncharacterized protein LOC121873259 isoform X1 n=1 Tax=Homarus americanus TaxID=6706 RepID=UPI001C44F657|nr:uncharacterized protein LOC121873259 isoform X1 [Homarus americanus]
MLDGDGEPGGTRSEENQESHSDQALVDIQQEEEQPPEEQVDVVVTQAEAADGVPEVEEVLKDSPPVESLPLELAPEASLEIEEGEHQLEIVEKAQDLKDPEDNPSSEDLQQDGSMAKQVVEEMITQVEEEMQEIEQEVDVDTQLQVDETLEVEHQDENQAVKQDGDVGMDAQEEGSELGDQGKDSELDTKQSHLALDETEDDSNKDEQKEDIPFEEQKENEPLVNQNEALNENENIEMGELENEMAIPTKIDTSQVEDDETTVMDTEEINVDKEVHSVVDEPEDVTSLDHQQGEHEEQELPKSNERLEPVVEEEVVEEVENEMVDDDEDVEVDEAHVDKEELKESEQVEAEEPILPEDSIEVDDIPETEAGQEEDIEGEMNGIAGIEGEVDDEDDLNDEELNPDGIINGTLSDGKSLPQCRLKRNYCCGHCGINTQNPREYLYHLRDEHGERMKVFECPRCIYASKNQQKLIRHARMVHKLKIKRQESSSPYKRRSKSPRAKVSPMKTTRSSVSPGKSTRSSPGKSPRSSESTPDVWDGMDDDDDSQMDPDDSSVIGDERKLYYCEHCDYSCRSRKLLNRHETSYHLKRRFFRCVKCNYVTHLKGRYTKHMKYHQLPILKCEYCDFRTPYRWNLDRHLKNHTEECGEYKCHLCNFTAQIKQSLTVHISNHHLTTEQIREREMRRTIGISDPADCTSDDQEMELLRLERDEHPDALILPGFDPPDSPSMLDSSQSHHNGSNSFRVSNIDMGGNDDSHVNAEDSKDEDGEPKRKKPKIKITLKKMKVPRSKDTFFQELNERHNFEEDFIHPDDVVHRHGNVYIKTFKCRFCIFKAAFKNEVARHEKKIHSIPLPKYEVHPKKAKKSAKSVKVSRRSSITSNDDVLSQILFPQPDYKNIASDIKISDTLDKLSEVEDKDPDFKGSKTHQEETNTYDHDSRSASRETSVEPPEDQLSDSKESSPSKDAGRKKGLSFFEKLQEKMPTSNVQNLVCQFCGHESKCLSESVRHQKLHLSAKNIYASASLSTRCQFCRHRCKTTDDLMNHLKLCPEARKNQITDSGRRPSGGRLNEDEDSQSSEKEKFKGNDEDDEDCEMKNLHKDEDMKLTNNNTCKSGDDKHPMENRVFVWNNFKLQEGEQGTEGNKDKTADESKEKVKKKVSLDSTKKAGAKTAGTKSPVTFEGPLDYIESPTPQGRHYYSKRVYRCPQCSFWATTASRFHVHIVGHFNRKPYNCSECGYKSNWRWDITKHIKLKTSRDNSHQDAQVIITDETGEKNYEKYDCYLAIIQLDETNAHRTEGGIPTRKGRPKRTPEKEEGQETSTPSASPVRKPPMVSIPVMPRLQGLPRLTRAPGRTNSSRPGPMPFGPILPGAQMMVQLAGSAASGSSGGNRPPPPLSLRGAPKSSTTPPTTSTNSKTTSSGDSGSGSPVPSGQYQIITPQGAVNTSLETLQLLASGSTNLSKLKKQQKGSVVDSEEKDSQATLTHQMRLLAWLNILAGGAEEQVSVSSTGEDGREVAKMVLDHEGNPEWKCNSCSFRDSERETIVQHVRLAHARNGPVSLLHAVHRCDICGYAAGTKRAVQLHIDTSHGGQGGITSRCEGQNPESKEAAVEVENVEYNESARTFQCRWCPFTCKKRSEMRPHLVYHTARSDCIFKCMFCPYYVPTKGELFEHLSIHGMEVPTSVLEAASKSSNSSSNSSGTNNQDEGGPRQFICGACPFETRSRAKLMHHRQFHKPKGLPFRCPHCSYNVTRRHLLSQHIRVHGAVENVEGTGASVSHVDDRSNSPSPSLTITPVGNAASGGNTGEDSALTDTSLLPKLTDDTTMQLDDIPLVWVSRDNRFFKMFKCRHCPHVNLRKTNIQEHEKMHKTDATKISGGLYCPNCSYVSVNAGVMSAHLKVHCGSMGQCHAVVDPTLSDEDQLRQLTSRATAPSSNVPQSVSEDTSNRKLDEKVLYYCQQCPARFFLEKEIQIHSRFHTTGLPHSCDHCNYGVRQPAHLLAHLKVHTPEYQQRTRTMMSQHRTAHTHPPVPGLTLPLDISVDTTEDSQLVRKKTGSGGHEFSISSPSTSSVPPQPPPTSKYMCDRCPASFSKLLTLQYHQSLHGANNPHQCHRCSYAGKTYESLQQHLHLHDQHDIMCEMEKTAKNTLAEKKTESQRTTESISKSKSNSKGSEKNASYYPPIKLKLIGLRPGTSDGGGSDGGRPQFKYYVEEQVPLSGVDLLRRKTQLEKEGHDKNSDGASSLKTITLCKNKSSKEREEFEEEDPKRIGDPKLHYPLHIDKVTGKSREKRYKCNKCPSAFEKTEQYHVHSNLHDSNHKYRCRICDYSVKFYANFMMHINRHKYHERMVSQNDGSPPPDDTDLKYEPIIASGDNSSQGDKGTKNRIEDLANKENMDDADLTTSERQHLLLQNKKGVTGPSKKDDEKERRVYYCQYCPYANVRRDAVDSHSLRHHANGGYGVYKCTFCDYTASQPNFIREHTKVHFRPFKYVHPEGYMRHDRQEILSTPILPPGGRRNEGSNNDDGPLPVRERHLIFCHETGIYKPTFASHGEDETSIDSQLASGIEVNFRSGDIIDAPNDFVISLRPGKGKGGQFQLETNEAFEPSDQMVSNITTDTGKSCDTELTKSTESHSFQDSFNIVVGSEKLESMEVDGGHHLKETKLAPSGSSDLGDCNKMEVDSDNLEVHSDNLEVHSDKLEVDGDKLEVDGDKLEVDGDKLEVDGDKLEVDGDKLEVDGDKLEVDSDKLGADSDKLEDHSDKLEDHSDKLEVDGDKLEDVGDKLEVDGDKLEDDGDKMEVDGDKLEVDGQKLEVVDSCVEKDKHQNGVLEITNGYVDGETQDMDIPASKEGMEEEDVKNKMEVITDESLQPVTKCWGTDQPEQLVDSH